MKTRILYAKSEVEKTNSCDGNYHIYVRKECTYNNGSFQEMDGYIHFWTKRKAEDVLASLKHGTVLLV